MKNLKFFLLIISITVNAQKGNGIALQQLRPTQPNYNYNYSYNPYLNNNKNHKLKIKTKAINLRIFRNKQRLKIYFRINLTV